MVYPKTLRILHAILILCILSQIVIGELMQVPGVPANAGWMPGVVVPVAPVTIGFRVHEVLGLIIAGLLLVRLMLGFSSMPAANWLNVMPWLARSGRKAFVTEVSAQAGGWKKGRLAPPEEGETVAKMAHGLMLLISIGIAIAGVILFFFWNEHGRQLYLIDLIGGEHKTMVYILIALLVTHVLAVILHQRQGHNILARMRPGGS